AAAARRARGAKAWDASGRAGIHPLLRVADDLLLLCRSRTDADAAERRSLPDLLLPTGMALHPEKTERADLAAGESLRWIGYRLARPGDSLEARIDEGSWERLCERLDQLQHEPQSAWRAYQTIRQWI